MGQGVAARASIDTEGTLGLDVLRQGVRVILDFRTMQLRIVRS